jgi:hypothetical protein
MRESSERFVSRRQQENPAAPRESGERICVRNERIQQVHTEGDNTHQGVAGSQSGEIRSAKYYATRAGKCKAPMMPATAPMTSWVESMMLITSRVEWMTLKNGAHDVEGRIDDAGGGTDDVEGRIDEAGGGNDDVEGRIDDARKGQR